MIVTIDGPSGSGKSTTARLLAERLGFEFLDTGSMFRALALFFLREDIDASGPGLPGAIRGVRLDVKPGRVWVNDEEVTGAIRTSRVSSEASRIAVYGPVRRFLAEQQRAIATGRDVVTEGRDQGTAVFPDAGCKFFLTADPNKRAERRFRELLDRGETVTLEAVLADLRERDRRDSSRPDAPLVAAADAVHIDTTELAIEDVLRTMEREIRRCRAG